MSNMKIWEQVEATDPKYVKEVRQRGGFTTVNAQYQRKQATKVFGAYGHNWGVLDEQFEYKEFGDTVLLVYHATLFYKLGDDHCMYGIHSAVPIFSKGRVDDEAYKKVATDALTKGLSFLGFNADIFMGQYDDNKYVNEMRQKFKEDARPGKTVISSDKKQEKTTVRVSPDYPPAKAFSEKYGSGALGALVGLYRKGVKLTDNEHIHLAKLLDEKNLMVDKPIMYPLHRGDTDAFDKEWLAFVKIYGGAE